MSEPLPVDYVPVPIREVPFDGLKLVAEPERSMASMPLEPSLEQARAVKGALSFLAALLAFYGEMIERDGLTDTEPSHSESSELQ